MRAFTRGHWHAPWFVAFAVKEVNVASAGDDAEEELAFEGAGLPAVPEDDGSDVDEPSGETSSLTIPSSVRAAILRLHQNTGHRSGKRLARALAIAGAPPEAIAAAKQLKCAICHERQPPRARRPASLPMPKDMGDQVHVDLLEIEDVKETKFYVAHATDYATRFQLAEVLPDKSTKSVVKFLSNKWLATFGPPRVLVCDQGREFISWEMEERASSQSVMLHHIAVQAPWQNGVAERSGGILKTIMSAVVASQGVIGFDEMQMALSESVAAYNSDINELGASPYQAAIGKQPRMVGDVLGGIQSRLAEHGLVESKPSFARQLALRETAKIAITRLHFSRGLRRAELARSRNPTVESVPEPGSICYFYRPLRYNNKTSASRKKLTLKRWHGPALLVATEGTSSAYLSYKGQLTKCALEHVRLASTMEQIASETWREAIDEAVAAAQHDLTLRSASLTSQPVPQEPDVPEQIAPGPNPSTPAFLPSVEDLRAPPGSDLPPVQPHELAGMLQAAAAHVPESTIPSAASSGRTSAFAVDDGPAAAASEPGSRKRASSGPLLNRGPLDAVIQKAQRLSDPSGPKRPAEVPAETLRAEEPETPVPPTPDGRLFDANVVSKEDVLASLGDPNVHPLVPLPSSLC